MTLYFSGVKSQREFDQLVEGRAQAILVDQFDLRHIPDTWQGQLALDSGAYRFSKNSMGNLFMSDHRDSYLELALSRNFAFRIAPDIINAPDLTWFNWSVVEQKGLADKFVPVWGWGTNPEHLDYYLERFPLIAIGGLVPNMRLGYAGDEFDKRVAASFLNKLVKFCTKYPQRFHLLGCCWLKAITQLTPLVASMDTSKWLAGSRRREVIFRHTLGYLADRKAPDTLRHLTSQDIDILNIQNLQAFSRQHAYSEDAW